MPETSPIARFNRYLDRFDSAGRKKVPMFSGVMAYFPDAWAALAEHSQKGNDKHNPGEPLHHARGKSMDHTDCIVRHVSNYKGMDGDSEECVALLWRAAALCQETLERKYGLTLPEGVIDARAYKETNSLVGPNGEQAPAELPKPETFGLSQEEHARRAALPNSRASVGLPPRAGEPKKKASEPWSGLDPECIPGN